MPLPLIIAGLAAGAIGAIEHKSAKETNEEAERKIRNAQSMYDDARKSLETAKADSNRALENLGNKKVRVLNGSVKQFVQVYDRIKRIKLSESVGLNEISNFKIEDQAVIELKEMADIYSESVSSGVAGATAGAVVALAASGSLPIVTGTLSIAGSMLTLGNVGVAAGYAGSALSAAASATPLAAIVAPVMLFTGISASMKADENLEKARTVYAQAEKACEEMKVKQTLCKGVAERSEMFNNLLTELDGMFTECTQVLDSVIKEKTGQIGSRAITADDLSVDELELIAVARSLAGAVKAVIDTPILEGEKLSENALNIYDDTTKCLPEFTEDVQNAKEAKKLSDEASRFFNDALSLYNNSQKSLLNSQVSLGEILLELGYTKKNILDNIVESFFPIYDVIKGICEDELLRNTDYVIDEEVISQLCRIMNVYSDFSLNGFAGIEAGVIIALAASGILPVKTGVFSTDEIELNAVKIEKVAGIDVPALAYGAAISPLGWIAIPEVSFDGISLKEKAKDNYENAKRIYEEAKTAVGKIDKSVGKCRPIIQKAGMVNKLLDELYKMFIECLSILKAVIGKKNKKSGVVILEKVNFTENELELVAVTEALAGAIIEIISIPLINDDGALSGLLNDVYGDVLQSLPEFKKHIENIRSYKLVKKSQVVKPLYQQPENQRKQQGFQTSRETISGEHIEQNLLFNSESGLNGYENQTQRNEKIKKKKPIILSIPVIMLVGLFTCGFGSLVMSIIRLKKYPERKKSSIVVLGICVCVLLIIIWGIFSDSQQKTESYVAAEATNNISDETINPEKNLEVVSDENRLQPTNEETVQEEIKSLPTDEEICSLFLEREANDQYVYSDVTVEQKEQSGTSFTAKVKCLVESTEGNKSAEYTLTWNGENERWNLDQIQEVPGSEFIPLHEPDDNSMLESVLDKEMSAQIDDGKEKRLEMIGGNWVNTDEEYSYMYQYLLIEDTQLFETRQTLEAEIKFEGETGCWDYENALCKYKGEKEKVCSISGIWEGVEYETYEASWKYIIEILSADSDDSTIIINSWCEFAPNGGEVERVQVCENEKVGFKNGEYDIPVGGYIVDHNPSDGMDFTYNFIIEQGKLFADEESETVYLSVQNPEMNILLGIEMVPGEKD